MTRAGWRGRRAAGALGVLVVLAVGGCGRSGPPSPLAPATRVTLSGTVLGHDGVAVGGARVDIVAGPNAGVGATADGAGRYLIAGLLPGALTLRATAVGFAPTEIGLDLVNSQTADLTLATTGQAMVGRVLDAFTRGGLSGVSITGAGFAPATSDLAGRFTLVATDATTSMRSAQFSAAAAVTRDTWLQVPGAGADVSLIPSAFDLAGFDQMFRTPLLRRWVVAPPLRMVSQVLDFEGLNATELRVLDEPVDAAARQSIIDDFTWALPQLTGGTFTGFGATDTVSPGIGSDFPVLMSGVITVARVRGLTAAENYWGYARWQWNGSNAITGGLIMLDEEFETSGSPYLRSLRSHELGHALGYNHVTSRASVMNSAARILPTALDLDGARLAFDRLPGNRSPDVDPAPASLNLHATTGAVWGPPVR